MKKTILMLLTTLTFLISIACSPASKQSAPEPSISTSPISQLSQPATLTPGHSPVHADSATSVQGTCSTDCHTASGFESIDLSIPGEVSVDLYITVPEYVPSAHSGLKPLTLTLWREEVTPAGEPMNPTDTRHIIATASYTDFLGDESKLNDISYSGITSISDHTVVPEHTYMYYLGGHVLDFDHYDPNNPDQEAEWSWYITQIGPVYVPQPLPVSPTSDAGLLELGFSDNSSQALEPHYVGQHFVIPLSITTYASTVTLHYQIDSEHFTEQLITPLSPTFAIRTRSYTQTGDYTFRAYATAQHELQSLRSPDITASLSILPYTLTLMGSSTPTTLSQSNIVLGANTFTFCCTPGGYIQNSGDNMILQPLANGETSITVVDEGISELTLMQGTAVVGTYNVQTYITGNMQISLNGAPTGNVISLQTGYAASLNVTFTPLSIDPSNVRMSIESSNSDIAAFNPVYNDYQILEGILHAVTPGITTLTVHTYMQNTPDLGPILPPHIITIRSNP